MAKYYVIPIDNADLAYFGIRSSMNPYNQRRLWCSCAPNIFGGNDDATLGDMETIFREAREESHFKIDINTSSANLVPIHTSGVMRFFAIRGNFTINPAPYFPSYLAKQQRYQECTGRVFSVNIRTLPSIDRRSTGRALFNACPATGELDHRALGGIEFLASEMAEAVRAAAAQVQAGTI